MLGLTMLAELSGDGPDGVVAGVQRLLNEQACRDCIVRAASAQDRHELDALAACFTADARLIRPDGTVLQGAPAIRAAYAARDPMRITRHLLSNQQLEWVDEVTVRARSLVLLWAGHASTPDSPAGREADGVQQVGEFDDVLRLTAHGWRIAQRTGRFVLRRSAA